ncbi:hypothetical protein QTG54_007509 [Skeletonema marinoi]|uniref:Uncharacterized protein n=1 Tax=Skeletonema marinoi TaxID=267567 RepID=A0AAD8Y8U5_9STRA|nr:hypothetical protein QTG54_007509 [Skeletonema marinoi]
MTNSPSMKSSAEEAQELRGLMASLDYLDAWEDDSKGVEEDSFALALADDILDIKLEEGDIIPDVVDIVEDDYVVPNEQQIRSRALMHLRLQCQPSEVALDEITALLESLLTCSLLKANLATEASQVGWWRESETLIPEVVRKAHLEHLVAFTFAVLQADAWKRSSDEIVPGQTRFNAQDDIRHICQIIPGIWNRVNHALARDSYALFGAGVDQLERSHAVNKMVHMFDGIPCQSE